MPSHKVNPKILMSNLRVDGPLNNTAKWLLVPSDRDYLLGPAVPVVVTPGAARALLFTFDLPAGMTLLSTAYLLMGWAYVRGSVAPFASHVSITLAENSGVWPEISLGNIDLDATDPVGYSWFLLPMSYATFGMVPPVAHSPPIHSMMGSLQIKIYGLCDAADLLSVTDLELCGDFYAVIAATGPP